MNTTIRGFTALAGIALLVLALALALGFQTAKATPGQVDLVAIDLDSTGNGPTTVGTIEGCRNDLVTGNTFTVDIVVNAIDAADGINGVALDLIYNPLVLRVNSRAAASAILFMQDAPAGTYLELGNPVPDADGDYRAEAVELGGPGTYESGPGVVVQITMEVLSSGVSDLTLDDVIQADGQPNILDQNSAAIPITNFSNAQVRSDGSACGAATDTPTPVPTPTPVSTEIPTDTPIPTPTPTPVASPTKTPVPGSICNTTLDAAAAVGATTITVKSATGCTAGDTIRIGTGSAQEDAKIASVSGTTITLVAALTKAHAAGETVVEVSTATGGATPGSQPATGAGSGGGVSSVLLIAMSLAGVVLLTVAGGSLAVARSRRDE